MRLTRIEIHGFKSFADRTQLEFPPGLTAVVGPNGCGKSNVIDAIKWALGEQRATALRGDEMLDVIFKGNGARPGRNFAEVSLVFDNEDGTLPLEYAEVVVSRRLFRSGESEYLINRQTARLKDVRNLLMDTGLGTGTYSIMEQGRIDAVLSANPTDRRRIFEEAAGISRYRARRRECESKLDRTEQNLLRLGDVVEELEKRSRSLKYQAGRARSYERTRKRMRELKALFYTHRWQEFGGELEGLELTVNEREGEEASARSALDAARKELGALQAGLEQARARVDEVAEEFSRASAAVDALSEREAVTRERLEEIAARRQILGDRVRGLELAQQERQRELDEVDQRVETNGQEMQASGAAVETAQGELNAAEQKLGQWQALADARRASALQNQAALTEARNRRAEQRSLHAALEASHARLAERTQELHAELESQALVQGELFAGARDLDTNLGRAREVHAEEVRSRDAGAGRTEQLDAELGAGRERLAAVASRHEALAELIARREGLSPGALTLLDAGLPGVEGLVVDHLHVPRELVDAVEVALGASAEAIVVATRADGVAALSFLADKEAGRVLILPRDAVRPRAQTGDGQRLVDLIRISGGQDIERVVEALLGHVRLVPDRDAFAHCPLDGETVYVTRSGEMLDERGVLRGGRATDEDGQVARRAECEALALEEQELGARVERLAVERARCADELAGIQARLVEAERRLRRLEGERERLSEREAQVAERRDTLERDSTLVEQDLERTGAELERARTELEQSTALEAQLEHRVVSDQAGEERSVGDREALDAAVGEQQRTLATAQVQLSALRERAESLTAERRQVQRGLEERRADLERARTETAELQTRRESLAAELQQLEERGATLAEERDGKAGELDAARSGSNEFAGRLKGEQQTLDAKQSRLDQTAEALSAARMQLAESRIHRDGLREKVLEELEVDLAECDAGVLLAGLELGPDGQLTGSAGSEADAGDEQDDDAQAPADGSDAEPGVTIVAALGEGVEGPPTAEQAAAAVDAVQPATPVTAAADAPAIDMDTFDWSAIEKEIELLRDRLARMGNVNLAAIDELAEVDERLGFLTGQRDDLVAAKKTLIDTIGRVNRESRERFVAAFEEVREHFRVIFRKLFQGGRADIMLEEGVDVLDAGIDILVAPPGKDQRSISLLSGGERTLTAVGLLFSLFRARPSPVCMLDEVDAALDETNIDRFCRVLEDFLGESQFLVVTHARRTMSYAGTIYGVTMQEHGISRVLSLTLAEYEQGKSKQVEGKGDVVSGNGGRAGRAGKRRGAASDGTADDQGSNDPAGPPKGRRVVIDAAAEPLPQAPDTELEQLS